MSGVLETLKKARSTIAWGWCQGCEARDIDGNETWIGSPTACRFCLTGAIIKANPNNGTRADCHYVLRKAGDIKTHLVSWNDKPGRTAFDVLELFDTAIEGLEHV